MHSQAIAHIDIIWPAAPVRNYPESLCTLFDGDTLHMFGWFGSCTDCGDICGSKMSDSCHFWRPAEITCCNADISSFSSILSSGKDDKK